MSLSLPINDADFDWIFFDCFNTLIDDFDDGGDESGLGSLPLLSVELGFFRTSDRFVEKYFEVRREHSQQKEFREITLIERLQFVLKAADFAKSEDERKHAIAAMHSVWETEYEKILRLTPGAIEMLAHWSVRKQVGVVSNFFFPFYPKKYLAQFGLLAHCRFVLDSAEFGYKKPSQKIFAQALSLAGLGETQRNRVLFIGDRIEADIAPAVEFGMHALHFNRSRSRQNVPPTPQPYRSIYHWDDFR